VALFNTDVIIDHLRGNREAMEILLKFKFEQNYCSVITIGEILFGMREKEREQTFTLIDCFTSIPVDKEIVILAYKIKRRAKSYKLQLYDCIISATAIKFDQVLITRNAKHYPDDRIKLFIPGYL